MMKRVGRWFLAVALLSAASLAAGTEELLDAAGFRLLFDGRDGLTVAHGARTAPSGFLCHKKKGMVIL